MSPVDLSGTRQYTGTDALPPAEQLQPPPAFVPESARDNPPRRPPPAPEMTAGLSTDEQAAQDFVEHYSQGSTTYTEDDMVRAFLAGIAYLRDLLRQQPSRDLPLTGTAESRTIAAALEFFIDQVLIHLPKDEVDRGEYLSVADAKTLVQRYKDVR